MSSSVTVYKIKPARVARGSDHVTRHKAQKTSTNLAAKICEQHVHDCVFEKTFMCG